MGPFIGRDAPTLEVIHGSKVKSTPSPRRVAAAPARLLRGAFWTIAIAVIAGYVFFAVVVGFSITDALGATLLVAALGVAWIAHAVWARRHHDDLERDPRVRDARQRRGF